MEKVKGDAVDSDGKNAIHLASMDLQCQYTIEVSSNSYLYTYMYVLSKSLRQGNAKQLRLKTALFPKNNEAALGRTQTHNIRMYYIPCRYMYSTN